MANETLVVNTDKEGRNIDRSTANSDVTVADLAASLVDGLSRGDEGLETALEEVLNAEGKELIKLDAGLDNTVASKAANQSSTFEDTLGSLSRSKTRGEVGRSKLPSDEGKSTHILLCIWSKPQQRMLYMSRHAVTGNAGLWASFEVPSHSDKETSCLLVI